MTDNSTNQQLSFPELAYASSPPKSQGLIKQQPEDFMVCEKLRFTPCGEGEHIYLWVEKEGQNTAYVAEQIAKQTGLPLRSVSYAGRKDKYAVTQQWFGLHAPRGLNRDISQLAIEGVKVLNTTRHNKKLKTGAVASNRFTLVLRQVSEPEAAVQRLATIAQTGVPNYFGDQRFGVRRNTDGTISLGGTLALAIRMVEGEAIRNRNKRNMAVSALRSALFNYLVSERIKAGTFESVCLGDACMLTGSNSFFIETGDTLAESQQRYLLGDLAPSAPLAGAQPLDTAMQMADWEHHKLSAYPSIVQFLRDEQVKTHRRPIKIWPHSLEWHVAHGKLTVIFDLPAGCFATSVLRECLSLNETQENGNE